jgi:hypothetical protein
MSLVRQPESRHVATKWPRNVRSHNVKLKFEPAAQMLETEPTALVRVSVCVCILQDSL